MISSFSRPSCVQRGLTLIELMVTLSVLVILITVGIPSFRDLVARNRLTASTNEILYHLQYARSESVKRAASVLICPSTDSATCATAPGDWEAGFIVCKATNGSSCDSGLPVLRIVSNMPDAISVTGPSSVAFGPAGNIQSPGDFEISVSNGGEKCIRLISSGRTYAESGPCS